MSGPTQEELCTVLDKYVAGSTWAVAMASVGRKEKTAFSWITKSQRAEQLNQRDSVYYLKWSDDEDSEDQADWYHNHLKSAARARRTILFETILVSQAMFGVHELVLDGSGKTVFMDDPAKIGMDDDMLLMVYGNTDRLLRDENNLPVPQTRVTQLPATLRQAILRGLMPGTYGDHSTVDVQSTNRVYVQHSYLRRPTPAPQPALPAPSPDAPAPAPERVESDVVREMKERLRASFKPPANPRPDPRLRPVEIYGRATGDKPDNVSAFPTDVPPRPDYPGASEAPAPKPARAPAPNYGRVSQIDKPGIGSRSNPPPGGFRIR